ncbi:MAG: alpha/beta fold hydrolase [Myxococcota bacterium]
MVADLHRIQAPSLILVGERDTHYLDDAELMARRIPRAHRVVVKGVGHAMNIEAPERFADEVMRFLGSVPEGPSQQAPCVAERSE